MPFLFGHCVTIKMIDGKMITPERGLTLDPQKVSE